MSAPTHVDEKLARLAEEVGTLYQQVLGRDDEDGIQQAIRIFVRRNRELLEAAIAGVAALTDGEREALHRSHGDLWPPSGFSLTFGHLFHKGMDAGLIHVSDGTVEELKRLVAYAKYVVDTTALPEVATIPVVPNPRAVWSPMTSDGVDGIVFRTNAPQGSSAELALWEAKRYLGPDPTGSKDPFLLGEARDSPTDMEPTASLWVPIGLEASAKWYLENAAGFELIEAQSSVVSSEAGE